MVARLREEMRARYEPGCSADASRWSHLLRVGVRRTSPLSTAAHCFSEYAESLRDLLEMNGHQMHTAAGDAEALDPEGQIFIRRSCSGPWHVRHEWEHGASIWAEADASGLVVIQYVDCELERLAKTAHSNAAVHIGNPRRKRMTTSIVARIARANLLADVTGAPAAIRQARSNRNNGCRCDSGRSVQHRSKPARRWSWLRATQIGT